MRYLSRGINRHEFKLIAGAQAFDCHGVSTLRCSIHPGRWPSGHQRLGTGMQALRNLQRYCRGTPPCPWRWLLSMGLLQTNLVERALSQPSVIKWLKRIVPPLDLFLLRTSRGWLNTAMQSVALLETTGAKSGQQREIATLCMPHAADFVLVGSNWGQDRDPAWAHNLRANPKPRVRFRGYVGEAYARELDGEERALVWQKLVEFNPQYARYQQGTQRQLPLFLLSRTQ